MAKPFALLIAQVVGSGYYLIVEEGGGKVDRCPVSGATLTCDTVAGDGTRGTGTGQLNKPTDAVLDKDGWVVIADTDNDRLLRCNPVTGPTSCAVFGTEIFNPAGIIVEASGAFVVTSSTSHTIHRCTATGDACSVIMGTTGTSSTTVGQFNGPYGITLAADGNYIIADLMNHRVQKCSATDSTCTVVVGTGTAGDSLQQLNFPTYAIETSAGDGYYIADNANHRVLKCLHTQGVDCTIVVGTGVQGDGLRQVTHPWGLLELNNQLIVADQGNDRLLLCDPTTTDDCTEAAGVSGAGSSSILSGPRGLRYDIGYTCTRPTTGGYNFGSVEEVLNPGYAFGFKATGITCFSGYKTADAGVSATACTSQGPYTVAGCTVMSCTRPVADLYDFRSATENLQIPFFQVRGVACVAGYAPGDGGIQATACTEPNPYTITGCVPIICTRPTAEGYDFSSVAETLDVPNFAATGIVCGSGFTGTASSAPCSSAGPYIVSGCAPSVCTRPSEAGYDFTGVTEDLQVPTFSVSGLACLTGYTTNSPAATVCEITSAYKVTGCDPIMCTHPNFAGYDFSAVTGSLALPTFGATGVACSAGYEAFGAGPTAEVCAAAGPYSVTGCAMIICTRPTGASTYDFSGVTETLEAPTFQVTGLACSRGYVAAAGQPVAQVCPTPGPYTVSGCELIKCTRPTTPGYDFTGATEALEALTFQVSGIECATGYEATATPSAVACAAPGPYSVTGCVATTTTSTTTTTAETTTTTTTTSTEAATTQAAVTDPPTTTEVNTTVAEEAEGAAVVSDAPQAALSAVAMAALFWH